ncbi:zinc-ribbon domain-containing protein [Kitasatospora sp. NPDC085895]|uniref:zinc-ribbon domain-containing protein n=1 Tax=Kitasatospora sp. NPDC085895 TaxID=3155057 RepID=UPI00344D133A
MKTHSAPAGPSGTPGRPYSRSLADAHPALLPTWHPDRNGSLRPDRIASQSNITAWWRCPTGHEWREKIAQRATMPKWKNGDVAACRQCTDPRVPFTYPACGCTVKVTTKAAERRRAKGHPRCLPCHITWWTDGQNTHPARPAQTVEIPAPKTTVPNEVPVPADLPPHHRLVECRF